MTAGSGLWQYHNPVAVTFGAGALDRLPHIVGARKAVLITFPEAGALGLIDRVRSLLGDAISGVIDRKSTRLNSSHIPLSRMPSSA